MYTNVKKFFNQSEGEDKALGRLIDHCYEDAGTGRPPKMS